MSSSNPARRRTARALALYALTVLAVGFPAAISAVRASAAGPAGGGTAAPVRPACAGAARAGFAQCFALIRTDVAQHRQPASRPDAAPAGVGYGPASLQGAYALPSSWAGSGMTVAVVDAYDDPAAVTNLATYRSAWGLPACNTSTGAGCLAKVNQNGQASPLPGAAGLNGWALEESLDVDMVSAICPNCRILLVEANSNSITDLGTGVNAAVGLGAGFVSNSYGSPESSGETSSDSYYNHQGVAITASSGDHCYGVSYPAASRYVTSVGGTSLTQGGGTRGWAESTWSCTYDPGTRQYWGTGSGCSAYEAKPSWQADTGCARRTDNDVAAVADPATGVAVYDTYDKSGWLEVGGTSAASPIIASTYALGGTPTPGTYPAAYPYAHTPSLYDVTSGTDSNGTCSPAYLCTAGTGYDGPTGWGTPDTTAAFVVRQVGAGSVARNSDGRLEIFAVGSGGQIWHDWQTCAGCAWSGWATLGGTMDALPTVIANADGRLEVFDTDANGTMWHDAQTSPGGGWGGWASLGGGLTVATPTVSRNADGRLEIFATAPGGGLLQGGPVWHDAQTCAGCAWGGWASLGTPGSGVFGNHEVAMVAAGENTDGRLEIFASTINGTVYHDAQTCAGCAWGGWASLGTVSAGSISAARNADGRLEIFALAPGGGALHNAQTSPGGSWGGWAALAGTQTSAPPVPGQDQNGSLEIFALASNGPMWHNWQTCPGCSWSGWNNLGGNLLSASIDTPAVGQNADGRLEIFATAPNGSIWHNSQMAPNGTWYGWSSLG